MHRAPLVSHWVASHWPRIFREPVTANKHRKLLNDHVAGAKLSRDARRQIGAELTPRKQLLSKPYGRLAAAAGVWRRAGMPAPRWRRPGTKVPSVYTHHFCIKILEKICQWGHVVGIFLWF